ncbi:MAG: thiamine pyrophosphate-dependent dehydrogenase E1 component subunit alpha, partial [Nitrososphaerales archaeon]
MSFERMESETQKDIFRVIDRKGNALAGYELEDKKLLELYRKMALTRQLDTKILSIQRQGRVGPYVPCAGEEAAMVASAFALQREDWLFSSYRELGAHLTRGLSVDLVLAQLFGNSNDLLKGRQMSNSWGSRELNSVPTAAPIGAYLPVAVGVSLAAKRDKRQIAVLTFFGDGATSASDFHTSMNFAGVYMTPTVFLCRNNGWAISLPVSKQTASETLAVKASAYGFEGLLVDG